MSNQTTETFIHTHTLEDASNQPARDGLMDHVFNNDNPVVRAHAAIISEHQDGSHSFTTLDYDAKAEQQLKVSTRSIVQDHFNQMASDFATLVNTVEK